MGSQSELYRFFLVLPPGFENLALRELFTKLPWIALDEEAQIEWQRHLNPEAFPGGLEISLPLEVGCALNQWLKIPARILIRIANFHCSDWTDLENGLRSVDWQDWLDSDEIDAHISARSSRLSHQRRLKQFLEKNIPLTTVKKSKAGEVKSKTRAKKAKPAPFQGVYLRLFRDEATLSLDTSGELLHRRGLRTHVSQAPIRENIAAGLLFYLTQGIPLDEWRHYQLLDPMAGAGTLLLEALDFAKPVVSRRFQFQSFPKLRAKNSIVRPIDESKSFEFASVIGIDLDARALHTNSDIHRKAYPSSRAEWKIHEQDFFSLKTDVRPQGNGLKTLVISNPPYGERLPVGDSASTFLERYLSHIEEVAAPYRVGLILPARWRLPRTLPSGWESLGRIHFENGGLPVRFHLIERQ